MTEVFRNLTAVEILKMRRVNAFFNYVGIRLLHDQALETRQISSTKSMKAFVKRMHKRREYATPYSGFVLRPREMSKKVVERFFGGDGTTCAETNSNPAFNIR